jgi:hypothetical protein
VLLADGAIPAVAAADEIGNADVGVEDDADTSPFNPPLCAGAVSAASKRLPLQPLSTTPHPRPQQKNVRLLDSKMRDTMS